MGAILHPLGVTFRVWTPFADSVAVAGDFNGWATDADPLVNDGDGYWSADVPAARAGSEYKFVVRRGAEVLWRNDPYARAVTSSAGNSIVCDPSFDWGEAPYRTPAWNELVLYELHVIGGTGADRGTTSS